MSAGKHLDRQVVQFTQRHCTTRKAFASRNWGKPKISKTKRTVLQDSAYRAVNTVNLGFPRLYKTNLLMLHTSKVAVWSDIRTKHIHAVWAPCRVFECLTLILRRSRTGTVWFYTSTSNKRAARPKLYTKSLTRDLKRMYSRLTLVRISINL